MTSFAMPRQADMAYPSDYEELLNLVDTMERALYNPDLSHVSFRLYMALIDQHPHLLAGQGQRTEIEVGSLRKKCGVGESSATRFFQDLSSAGKIIYESFYDKEMKTKRSFVTDVPETSLPEGFDTNTSDRKRKAREAEEKRRNQFRDPRKLWNCEVCGGELLYDATAHCKSCGHVHATIKDIPASEITIEAEVHEIAEGDDSWLNEWDTPTIEVQTVRPGAIQQQLPETPRPAEVGKHPRGIACPDCHAMNNWRAVPADWGGEIYVCAICYPEKEGHDEQMHL